MLLLLISGVLSNKVTMATALTSTVPRNNLEYMICNK
jgi:hypothetical protein